VVDVLAVQRQHAEDARPVHDLGDLDRIGDVQAYDLDVARTVMRASARADRPPSKSG
jgi:hypothetical protein